MFLNVAFRVAITAAIHLMLQMLRNVSLTNLNKEFDEFIN